MNYTIINNTTTTQTAIQIISTKNSHLGQCLKHASLKIQQQKAPWRKPLLLTHCLLLLLAPTLLFAKGNVDQQPPSAKDRYTDISLLLDWTPNTNHIGAYVALHLGFFEDEKLKVTIPPVAESSVESLVGSGKAEFGFSYQESVTFARASDTPIPVVAVAAVLAHNTSGFAAPLSSGIKSPSDFAGKTYGSFGSPIEEATLQYLMNQHGYSSEQITFVQTSTLDFFQGTSTGVFDFAWIFEGWTGVEATIQNEELYYLPLREIDELFDYYTPVIISSEEYIRNNPETAKAFMRALSRGYQWAKQNPSQVVDTLLFYAPELDRQLVEASMFYLTDYFVDANLAVSTGATTATNRTNLGDKAWGLMKREVWKTYTSWLQENGFIESGFSIEGAYTNSLLEE